MKYSILCFLFVTSVVSADTYVNPYTRSNGTYVPGHHRTDPNNTTRDNYSTYPNYNPYTGSQGTRRENDNNNNSNRSRSNRYGY